MLVCVWERETEAETRRESNAESTSNIFKSIFLYFCVYLLCISVLSLSYLSHPSCCLYFTLTHSILPLFYVKLNYMWLKVHKISSKKPLCNKQWSLQKTTLNQNTRVVEPIPMNTYANTINPKNQEILHKR